MTRKSTADDYEERISALQDETTYLRAELKEVLDALEELASADPDMGSWFDTQKKVDAVLAKHGRGG